MSDIFYTLEREGQAVVREKMSRFLAFAWPVSSQEQCRELVAKMQNEYHDARHVCWGYVLGTDNPRVLSSDNGEPSGTAGKPIVGQINSLGLTNVLVVVVRYFGGIKLGTSGLIVAYRTAARQALEHGGIKECHETVCLRLTFGYTQMNTVMTAIKGLGAEVMEQDFNNTCVMSICLRKDYLEPLKGIVKSEAQIEAL